MSNYRRSRVPGAAFFFTVTLADRRATTLVDRVDALRRAYRTVERLLPFETIAICILPDHLHAVWKLPEHDADFSKRWRWIKSNFSRDLSGLAERSPSKRGRREKGIWQRRFWEHQIRDGNDLERHVDYIHYNPVKHGWVGRVGDWPYSSFHRYMRNGRLAADWGGAEPSGSGSREYGEP